MNIWGNPAENFAMLAKEVRKSSLRPRSVRRNRRSLCSKFLGCWLFCQLWEDLGLRKFWHRGFGRSREGSDSGEQML